MQWILGVLASLITEVFKWSYKRMTIRYAWIMAMITASIAAVSALAVAIKALLVGIAYTLPSWAAPGVAFLPSNIPIVFSTLTSAYLLRMAYDLSQSRMKEYWKMLMY